jgi:hypothetical protein
MRDELHYVRSGGFAGGHDELTIQPNGDATLTTRGGEETRFRMSDGEMNDLQSALDDADLEGVAADSTSDQPAPDAFSYAIVYGDIEVRTDDPSVLDELKDLLALLTGFVEGHRTR